MFDKQKAFIVTNVAGAVITAGRFAEIAKLRAIRILCSHKGIDFNAGAEGGVPTWADMEQQGYRIWQGEVILNRKANNEEEQGYVRNG